MSKEKILIVGGGFGGVKTALDLVDNPKFDVTLLSDQTDLRYYPTLYHTATGGINANSSIPLSELFNDKKITLAHGKAVTLDRKAKTITTESGTSYTFDTLVLALGVVTNYFGIDGMEEYSYSIKSQAAVAKFKAHLKQQLEDAHKPDLHYVIVGAGPTGIELAGALPDYLKHLMKSYGIHDRKVHIDLIEASPRLLPRMPKKVSRLVTRRLRRLGIKIYTGSAVQATTADELTVNGKAIRSHTVVWTAGVTNHPFFKDNSFVMMGRGKVGVDTYLQAEENIFVIGDNANTPFSGTAQTALTDAIFLASNLSRRAAGKSFKSYKAKPPITVIPAGNHWATVQWGKVILSGRIGWLLQQAAYVVGFHDLQPWPEAAKQYMTLFQHEESTQTDSR